MSSRVRRQSEPRWRRRRSLFPRLEALEVRLNLSTTQLVVDSPPPATVTAGQVFALTLAAEDSGGNVDPSFVGSVTLALANNPGGASCPAR